MTKRNESVPPWPDDFEEALMAQRQFDEARIAQRRTVEKQAVSLSSGRWLPRSPLVKRLVLGLERCFSRFRSLRHIIRGLFGRNVTHENRN
jgi:hypothetical protein